MAAEEPAPLYGQAYAADIQKYGNVRLTLKQSELYDAGYAIGDVLKVRFLDQILGEIRAAEIAVIKTMKPTII